MADPDHRLRRLAPAARFILQGERPARESAGRAFGLALPEEACRAHVDGERAALWLGPDEQLLMAAVGEAGRVQAELTAALQGLGHSLVEVSQRQAALAVTGSRARDLIASGCPLDLDPASFPIGMCVRTLFAKAEVVLWRRSAEEYHLEVARSFAGYVLDWMREVNRSDYP